MTIFQTSATLIALAATASYINHRFLKLPSSIGLMTIAMVASLGVIFASYFGFPGLRHTLRFVGSIDFGELLLHGMLAFLLFAGALHVNLNDLNKAKLAVALLSTAGVLIATVVVGGLIWLLMQYLGFGIPLIYALLFGALISPTDPIAVLALIKKVKAPKQLETKIAGESLFNDGVAVVVFITLLSIARGGDIQLYEVTFILIKDVVGGLILGTALGYIVYRLLSTLDQYTVEILLTVALACGSYALAEAIHVSAPIAAVAAGLIIGNHGRSSMSSKTREHVDTFWELIDEILTAILFVLIGINIVIIEFKVLYLILGAFAIVIVLFGRLISVAIPIKLMESTNAFVPGTIKVLTWGGLRGGISIALALSLPNIPEKDAILTMTYIVVVFSVLVQGLSFGKLIKQLAIDKESINHVNNDAR